MQLILFSKMFKEKSIPQLAAYAHEIGIDGYDLAVRSEHPVNPDNASKALPQAAQVMRESGLNIGMVTAEGDLLLPDHPTAKPLLAAMDKADVRLLKLGYFRFNPDTMDYWQEVDRVRQALAGWEELGREHNVKICYHTHSNRCMGLNCASLAHLIRGFDPEYIGAYIDPCHMRIEGEEFAVGAAMVKERLSIVALKDVLLRREAQEGHSAVKRDMVPAGQGMVDFPAVLAELLRLQFQGPLTIHCEFEVAADAFQQVVMQEVAFFRQRLTQAQTAVPSPQPAGTPS